jgi:hypothetical protein
MPTPLILHSNAQRNAFYANQIFAVSGPAIAAALAEPTALLTVEEGGTGGGPAYLMNFRILPEKRNEFAMAFLPQDLFLAPIQVRSQGPTETILTLNVYEVDLFDTRATRAEWSDFVAKDDDEENGPRFLVVEAVSSEPSFDPVNLLTPPAVSFHHTVDTDSGDITTMYQLVSGMSFTTTFAGPKGNCNKSSPKRGGGRPVISANCDIPTQEFITTNDEIYCGNGVYDNTLHTANLWELPLSIIDPKKDTIMVDISATQWAEFVDPEVSELLVLTEPFSFFLQPTFNLEEIAVCLPLS